MNNIIRKLFKRLPKEEYPIILKDDNFLDLAINPKTILLDCKITIKNDLLNEMVKVLFKNGDIPNTEDIIKGVLEREDLMSTGLQNGIAIPHCKTDSVNSVKTVIALCKNGIDFDSLDGQPTKIIVLIVSPLSNPEPHMKFLSTIGSILNTESNIQDILDSKSQNEVKNKIIEKEN